MNPQPQLSWTVSGGGTVDASGLFTAGNIADRYTLTASSGSVSSMANVVVISPVTAVTLIEPNGGQSYTIGDTIVVTWRANPDSIATIYVKLQVVFETFMISGQQSGLDAGDGLETSFSWAVPDSILDEFTFEMVPMPGSDQCIIQVSDYNLNYVDKSDQPFSIIADM
jgi:hypothetical protein